MSEEQPRKAAQPPVEGVTRWLQWIDRRDAILRARLQKLVRSGRTFEWLCREWWRRENERHSRRTISYLEAVARNKRTHDSQTDQPITVYLEKGSPS